MTTITPDVPSVVVDAVDGRPAHTTTHDGETWARVDAGFYVGSRAGAYLGAIESVRDGFVALDSTGTPVGRYASRDLARQALRSVLSTARAAREPQRRAAGLIPATVVGAVAGAAALTAAAATPFL